MKKAKNQSNQSEFTLSFVLGGNENEALRSLLEIKDAMASGAMLKLEDELSMDDQTATYCRLFYQAADLQYRQLLARK